MAYHLQSASLSWWSLYRVMAYKVHSAWQFSIKTSCVKAGIMEYMYTLLLLLLLLLLLSLAGNSGRLTWARLQQPKEQRYPFQVGCAVFSCVQTMVWLPVFGILNVHTHADAGDCTRGLCGHPKRVCTRTPGIRTFFSIAPGLSVRCSTNWTIPPLKRNKYFIKSTNIWSALTRTDTAAKTSSVNVSSKTGRGLCKNQLGECQFKNRQRTMAYNLQSASLSWWSL